MENRLKVNYTNGKQEIFPTHEFVWNWVFQAGEEDEALLANSIAAVAEKNGMSKDEVHKVFPYILRMLKSNIEWAK